MKVEMFCIRNDKDNAKLYFRAPKNWTIASFWCAARNQKNRKSHEEN